MNLWHHLKRPPWRTLVLLLAILGVAALAYWVWTPGRCVRDGRHDRRTNAVWLQHGWLGDDAWFQRNRRDPEKFRNDHRIQELAGLLSQHGVKYVFPHACPCSPDGTIAPVDPIQTERFLDRFSDFSVLPWVGGVLDLQCQPGSTRWRNHFAASVATLLRTHPRLAGVHLNIEPLPSGNPEFLLLLDELRHAMPAGKILSVAAYPPPTRWHPYPDVHWDQAYFREVARRVDQMVPMMYDTSLKVPKLYEHLMSTWTPEVLAWATPTQVLLGVPAYEDAGVTYHFPRVESLQHALWGIHAGLGRNPPPNYSGVAIYCEWEMTAEKWDIFSREFEHPDTRAITPVLIR